ncbi:amino acid permease [Mesorhizobium sp. M2D.F.Ca.ET.185.01.1.1]|uniref:APC family permease n=1 Tax=unclassified Mesorhizobium TaxID=325217 RepID=UPI000FCABF2D|nr:MULTISPECIES: amino acid permease [unclassified Mesorhizobium]TGP56730.1 amino acid permease [bacterium M00.F.Ca.ET.230.01.1.1]TGP75402.1 amino acid permease [bacterium M00.F.Ca.ET.227.01.1.1]TGP90281.1 amino acid permease [bacterium M00.F.Ca.ET.222.01.1.1]TGP96426.1 amino acid permease [bacterium M00.F.Ca.ET.221.01.1.1]TGT67512.1 amino acid permease [bacterium M00.F.Ca.ET.159.01.1.1]TGT79854.1 amino acid permease [bacterium M00.F.Ca.ET.157.01.1.1]TGT98360.1 amino acid permease [bacterium
MTAAVDTAQTTTIHGDRVSLLRVLGPAHVWALGVGIVLVGEFTGWNFSADKGGALAALIVCWIVGLLYTSVAMIDSEVTSTVAAAGGQYAQAKHIVGPLMAFNVALFLVFAYTMLEVSDAILLGDTIVAKAGVEGLTHNSFIAATIVVLAWLNYRGVLMTLNVNFVITAIAYVSIVILFFSVSPWTQGAVLKLNELVTPGNALPYGWIGVIAAFQFGIWYYLGIEGTTQAAEEVRSPARSLPYGTMAGMITLLIAAAMTWYVCASMMPWEYLGITYYPLWDAGKLSGSPLLENLLFIATLLSALASANGCINDAARAWFSLGRDRYLPSWFSAVHPKYRTPYRSILFLLPIALAFAFIADLNQAITFSILSGVLQYTFMSINIMMFRKKWPLGTIRRGYTHPFHPLPAIVLFCLCMVTFFAIFLGFGSQLIAMTVFYFLISLWFHFYRYKFVRRGDQFSMPWPKPQGY